MRTLITILISPIVFTLAVACAPADPNDRPDGPLGKGDSPYADSPFHDCARSAALQLVNDPGTDAPALVSAGVSADGASRMVAQRPFNTVQALETAPGVGLDNVRALLSAVGARCAGYSFPRPCQTSVDSDADGSTDRRTVSTYDDYGRHVRMERWKNGAIDRVILRGFDAAGNYVRLEQQQPDASGRLVTGYISERSYDDRGRKLRELEDKSGNGQWEIQHDWTYGDGAEPIAYAGRRYGADKPGTTAVFRYDAAGRLSEELWYGEDQSGDDWFERRTFEYDARGLLTRQVDYARAFDELYSTETRTAYNDAGLELSSEIYVDGAFDTGSYATYDGNDLLIQQEDKEGDVVVQRLTMAYDADGRLIREQRDGGVDRNDSGVADGTVDATTELSYDAGGNVISSVTSAPNGDATSRTSYDYGCWTTP